MQIGNLGPPEIMIFGPKWCQTVSSKRSATVASKPLSESEASHISLGKVMAITFAMAGVVWMVQPYAQPQADWKGLW